MRFTGSSFRLELRGFCSRFGVPGSPTGCLVNWKFYIPTKQKRRSTSQGAKRPP
jgi:hypothetical protein